MPEDERDVQSETQAALASNRGHFHEAITLLSAEELSL